MDMNAIEVASCAYGQASRPPDATKNRKDQVIDKAIRTPYEALEPLQMLEYTEMEREMAVMDQMGRKEKRELKRRRRNSRNPLYRLACICGLA